MNTPNTDAFSEELKKANPVTQASVALAVALIEGTRRIDAGKLSEDEVNDIAKSGMDYYRLTIICAAFEKIFSAMQEMEEKKVPLSAATSAIASFLLQAMDKQEAEHKKFFNLMELLK